MVRESCEFESLWVKNAGISNSGSEMQNLEGKWRRGQDSNLQARKGGSFQDYCITNYATSPWQDSSKKYTQKARHKQILHCFVVLRPG